MSGGFTLLPEMSNGTSAGFNAGATSGTGTLVQGNTSVSNTKGSWVQLTASSVSDAVWMMVELQTDVNNSGNLTSGLVDIGVGAAASEVVIASNLHINAQNSLAQESYFFPVNIPAGTRIAARCSNNATTLNSIIVSLHLFDGNFSLSEAAGLDDIGLSLATSLPTKFTPGASGSKSAYTQLVASTARDYMGFLVTIEGLDSSAAGNLCTESVDIGVGAGGSEVVLIPDVTLSQINAAAPTAWRPYFTSVPAGTRIAARAASNKAVPSANFWVGCYGIYQ